METICILNSSPAHSVLAYIARLRLDENEIWSRFAVTLSKQKKILFVKSTFGKIIKSMNNKNHSETKEK